MASLRSARDFQTRETDEYSQYVSQKENQKGETVYDEHLIKKFAFLVRFKYEKLKLFKYYKL